MSKIKRFLVTAGIYLVGNALSKLIGFFLLPLYTGKLPPEQFGMFDLVVTVVTLSVPVVFFQIWDGMFRLAFEKNDPGDKYCVISNSFTVWGLGLVIYSIFFMVLLKELRFENGWLIFLYGAAVAVQYQYLFIARAFLRNKLFVVSGLVNSLLSAITNIILILQFKIGIESLYIAPILGCLVQMLMIEAAIHPMKYFNMSAVKIKKIIEMVRFSVPLCVATVLYWLLTGYTKIAISQQLGTYANGLYAVASRFCSMMTFLITVFQYAWYEMAYLMAKDIDRTAKYERSVEYIFKVVLLGSGVFMLLTKLVFPYFIDKAFREAVMIVPLSLIGVAVNAFASFIDTIFMAEKQTRWIYRTTVIGAGINIAALWILTPVWGLQGAVGALCLAFIVLVLFRIYILDKMFSIRLHWSNFIYVLMLAAAICVFYTFNDALWLTAAVIILSGISVYSLRKILIPLFGGLAVKSR